MPQYNLAVINIDRPMAILLLILVSSGAWFVSTLAGGGSPFILMPLIDFWLGAPAVPPVITTGMLLGNSHRVWFLWKDINWETTWWYLPGAIAGSFLGGFVFTHTQMHWLQILLGLFLISSIFTYGFGKKERSFTVQKWYFLPAGFMYAFLSGLVGSIGPVLNPFYLNYGLVKEEMIATKSTHMVVVHIAKMISYAVFGALTWEYLGYGLAIGIAAVPGNWLGQKVLTNMSEERFRQLVLVFVTLSGIIILWDQREFLTFW